MLSETKRPEENDFDDSGRLLLVGSFFVVFGANVFKSVL